MNPAKWAFLGIAVLVGSACGGTSTFEAGAGGAGQGGSGQGGSAGSATGGTAAGTGGSSGSSAATGGSGGDVGGRGGSSSGGKGASGGSAGSAATGGTLAAGGSSGRGAGGDGAVAGIGGDAGAFGGTAGSSAGTAGTAGFDCGAPPMLTRGDCVGGFYADVTTGQCKGTEAAVCISGPNNFRTLQACLDSCPGTVPAPTACSSADDCVLVTAGCCGLCPNADEESIHSYSFLAVQWGAVCGDVACQPCADVPVPNRTSDYFVSTCNAHACGVEDLRKTDATACSEDSDCFLRLGSGCCESCTGENYIALSSTDFLAARCTDISCPPCVPTHSPDYAAHCVSGRCEVEFAVSAQSIPPGQ